MVHDDNTPQKECNQDSILEAFPKEGDFIMSASAPFTSSIVALNCRHLLPADASITAAALEDRRPPFTPAPPRAKHTKTLRGSGTVVAAAARGTAAATTTLTGEEEREGEVDAGVEDSVRNTSPTPVNDATFLTETMRGGAKERRQRTEATTTTTAAVNSSGCAGGMTVGSAAAPRVLCTPLWEAQAKAHLGAAVTPRAAMSPLSAAGRLAYVADVTSRVHRTRMRGRRAPEVALASAHTSGKSSESGSPLSLNLPPASAQHNVHLPRLTATMSRARK